MDSNKITKYCDDAIFYFACGLIYFLPISTGLTEWGSGLIITAFFVKRTLLHFCGSRQQTFNGVTTSLRQKLAHLVKAYKPTGAYINKPLGFFVLINLLSVIVSQYPGLSWQGFVCKLLQGTLVLCGIVDGIKTRKRIGILVFIFCLSSLVVGSNGIYQYFKGVGFIQGREVLQGRLRSSLKHANDFGGYLIVVLPLVLSLLLWCLSLRQSFLKSVAAKIHNSRAIIFYGIVLIILSVILFLCLGFTISRGAWFGFFVALFVLGWFQRKTIVPFIVLTFLFAFIFFPRMNSVRHMQVGTYTPPSSINQAAASDTKQRLLSKLLTIVEARLGSSMGRSGFWREALMVIRDFPVFGTGLNTYSKVGVHYKINWGGYPHNCYLQMAAETGVLGLGAFIWLIFVIFKESFRVLRIIKDPFLDSVLLGMTAGMAGFMTHSFFDTNFYSVQLGALCWLMLGLLVAVQKMAASSDTIA